MERKRKNLNISGAKASMGMGIDIAVLILRAAGQKSNRIPYHSHADSAKDRSGVVFPFYFLSSALYFILYFTAGSTVPFALPRLFYFTLSLRDGCYFFFSFSLPLVLFSSTESQRVKKGSLRSETLTGPSSS